MSYLIPSTAPIRAFEDHQGSVNAVAVFPYRRRMITGSSNHTLRLWDLETGVVLKKMEGHRSVVWALAVSRDGQMIASSAENGEFIAWHGETGESLTQPIQAHSNLINSVDFSPDGTVLATGSFDGMTKFWCTKTWQMQGDPIECGYVHCVRYSPSGELLAIATTDNIQIYNPGTRERVASFKGHITLNMSLAWTPDGTRLLSGGDRNDPTIREWDALTWKQVGRPWKGHTNYIWAIAIDPTGTLVASASEDKHVRLWRLSDRQNVGIFEHSSRPLSVTFSVDGRHILSGGYDKISEWEVPKSFHSKIHAITTAHHACVTGDLSTTEELLTQDIHTDANDHTSYARRFFNWELEARFLTTHQKRCQAFLSAGKPDKALEVYKYMMDTIDESTKTSCLVWSNAFKQECSALCAANGDAALAASDYDRTIELYTAAITLNSESSTFFANRSKAKLGKMLWLEALLDAQKVIELDSLSYLGYNLKHAALHGAQRYDEAIQAFRTMLSKLEDALDIQTQQLRHQYLRPSQVERAIRQVINDQLENAPLRVLDTTTGLLCDREAQISAFKTSTEYKELLSSTTTRSDFHTKHIEEVVRRNLQFAMLSHRWEGKEPLLQDIQGKSVYDSELNSVGGMTKLRSFCKTAYAAGYNWAWSDTCCIDKNINVELQESVNSMFVWYHHSALTIVYLSDVPPSSKSGALAKSVWNTRGWTVQEFIAPRVILFYQSNWTLYLDDRTPNHKDSIAIMQELKNATGIDRSAVVAFRPSMNGAREKLHWASTRVTTRQEDIAYSLFGIFGVRLSVDYGEKQDKALGRLLQEIVARSGDITGLDWVGKSSDFNSCLPASIASYEAPPCKLPFLPEDEIQSSVSSLRKMVAVDFASNLYTQLRNVKAPRFATQRLHLPCIAFDVREVRRVHSPALETRFTYRVKANGLQDLLISTDETLVQFWPARPIEQNFVLVRPWDRSLLELPDFVKPADFGNITESEEDHGTSPSYPSHDWSSGPPVKQDVYDPELRALRLLVRLGQSFSAFLLAQQRSGEYKRIASDHDIIGQVNDIRNPMDIRTVEIL
ncbi:hypothetical protein CY34DRAFT_806482 [Suillus luteus UH-Slu-Lm8-n1]|uniref:Heterokaryon incompatibility domain-containing protein n=1 Tax=Suillus luteus UH-Slu-Lm8-n1 TaxID=930992 RepID=A0A0D0B3L6_9AGAM|nr:hypothetical protein CY34DRAFT_806482 [Suillus luteus UH-Slu-Lm8-n1]